MGNSQAKLQNTLFELQFTSKTFQRHYQKCQANERKYKKQVQKAIADGHYEVAKVHASNAIREKNTGINYLKMASKLDSVQAKLNQALAMQQLTPQMAKITKSLGVAMKGMNPEKIGLTMDKFENILQDLDVTTGTMTSSMDSVSATSAPTSEVDDLMKQVADEHDLELFDDSAAPTRAPKLPQQQRAPAQAAQQQTSEEDEMMARLQAL